MTSPQDDQRPQDPRPGIRFSDAKPRSPEAPRVDPQPGLRFDAEQPSRQLPVAREGDGASANDPALEPILRPRKRRWGLLAVLAGAAGLGTAELITGLPAALAGGDWLNTGWQILGLGVIGLGTGALGRELFRLRRLKRHDNLRQDLSELPRLSPKHASALVERLRQQLALHDDHPHWQAFSNAREAHHDGRDLAELVQHHLLAPRDREARRLISRMSSETAVMVAVSPLTLVDMGLVAWRHLAMIDRICRIYGLELGYGARLRLLRSVLYQMAFAGATELATDASMQMLTLDLAGRLSARAAQGLGVGLLGARLGLRTQQLARPLAFTPNERPRLTDLRKELWQQLKRMEAPKKGQD